MEQTTEHVRACYDEVAREYAERFAGELAHKPLDQEVLARFAAEVRGRGECFEERSGRFGRFLPIPVAVIGGNIDRKPLTQGSSVAKFIYE